MKFSVNLLTLLSISSSLAVSLSPQCNKAIDDLYKKYKKEGCNIDDTMIPDNMLPSVCGSYNAKKCKEFGSIDFFDLPECKNNDTIELLYNMNSKANYLERLKLKCTMDENNKYCPLNHALVTESAIKYSCKSQVCTTQSINYFENVLKNNQNLYNKVSKYNEKYGTNIIPAHRYIVEDIESILNYLKSDKCAHEPKKTIIKKPEPEPISSDPVQEPVQEPEPVKAKKHRKCIVRSK